MTLINDNLSALPHAIDAEVQVIGSLVLRPALLAPVARIVRPADFVDDCHRATFAALLAMARDGVPIDVVSVAQKLKSLAVFTGANRTAVEYLAEVGRNVAVAVHAEYFAREVHNATLNRRLYLLLTDAASHALNGKPGAEVSNELRASLNDFSRDLGVGEVTSATMFEQWVQSVVGREAPCRFEMGPVSSPLRAIDVRKGTVLVIGGPTGAGKTALVGQMVFDAVAQEGQEDLRLLLANCEMSPQSMLDRRLACMAGINHHQIRERIYPAAALPRVEAAICALEPIVHRINFMGPPFSMERVAEQARDGDVEIVVVDYLQRFDIERGSVDQRARTTAVMDFCRRIADEERAVIALAALNRTGTSGEQTKRTVGLSSLRDSSEIEYGADCIYILVPDKSGMSTLLHLKNRHGILADIDLEFDGALQRFSGVRFQEQADLASDRWK